MKNFLHYHFPEILWIGLILLLTCIPGSMIPQIPAYLDLFKPDKLVHFFLFTVLVFLLLFGRRNQLHTTWADWFSVLIALNIGIFLGGITELLQGTALITGRLCSVYDFIANVTGCFAGWGVFVLIRKMKQEHM